MFPRFQYGFVQFGEVNLILGDSTFPIPRRYQCLCLLVTTSFCPRLSAIPPEIIEKLCSFIPRPKDGYSRQLLGVADFAEGGYA